MGENIFFTTEIKYFGSQTCGPKERSGLQESKGQNILSFLLNSSVYLIHTEGQSVNRVADSCRETFIWLEGEQQFDDP